MARQGDVPAHPLGNGQRRVWRFLLSELDVWMRERVHRDAVRALRKGGKFEDESTVSAGKSETD